MFRALAFLELNYALNQIRAILKAPQRLAIWIPTTLALLVLYFYRIDRPGPRLTHLAVPAHGPIVVSAQSAADAAAAAADSQHIASSALGYLFIALAAIAAGLALAGRTAVFRSSAEAVLFSNVGMPPLLVAVWLQARKLVSSFRILTGALYIFVFINPGHASAAVASRGLAIALLSFAIPTCIQLPAFLLRRSPVADAIAGVMWGLAALTTGAGGAVILGGPAARTWLSNAHVDPGPFVQALANGDPLAALVVSTIVVALCGSIVVLGRDAIPDFYRATTQGTVQRGGNRRFGARRGYAVKVSRWQIPMGPFAYVWKDWIAFRRARGKFQFWLATLSFWCVVGTLTSFTQSRTALGMLALTCLMFLVGVAPVTAGEDLAADLTKPLFWLARDSVSIRIAAITFGRAARTGVALGVAPLCAALFDGNLLLAVSSLPLAIVFAWGLQAMGTALYAYFPADLDQRGPIVYVRLVLGVVFLIPVPTIASFAFAFLGPAGGIATALIVAGAEGAFALWLASERFERRGGAVYGRFGARA